MSEAKPVVFYIVGTALEDAVLGTHHLQYSDAEEDLKEKVHLERENMEATREFSIFTVPALINYSDAQIINSRKAYND